MSVKDVKMELDEIELQQQGLEKQGVRLEQLIRDKSETGQENEGGSPFICPIVALVTSTNYRSSFQNSQA